MNTKHIITIFISLLILTIILNNGIAQDYTQQNLPEKAKARIGKGSIRDIDFSPDGTQFAVGSPSGVWLYDANTRDEIGLLTEHTIEPEHIVFSPDGKTLAYGKYGDILLWDVEKRKLKISIEMQMQFIDTIRFTNDGRGLLCKNSDSVVTLWDIDTGEKNKEFYPTSFNGSDEVSKTTPGLEFTGLDLSLDSRNENSILAYMDNNNKIRLEDANTGQLMRSIDDIKSRYGKLVLSPDGTILVIHSIDGPVRLWDINTGKHLGDLTKDPRYYGLLEFSRDGKTLVSQTKSDDLEIWDVATKTLQCTIKVEKNKYIHSVAFPLDGKKLVGANRHDEIFIWNAYTGEELFSSKAGHTNPLITLDLSLDSRHLAISTYNDKIQLWELFPAIQLSKRIEVEKAPLAFSFSADGNTLTSAAPLQYNKRIRNNYVEANILGKLSQWDTKTGEHLSDIPIELHREKEVQDKENKSVTGWISVNVMLSQNGYILATCHNGSLAMNDSQYSVLVWDVLNRNFHDIFKGHTKKIRTLAITPNGRMIASGSDDKTIRVWDVNTATEMLTFASDDMLGLSFSMDGKLLASTSSRSRIRLWDMSTIKQLPPLNGENGFARALAFSPDNKTLASGSREGTIHLWDIATSKIISTIKGHTNWIKILRFSPDGKTLVSGGAGGVVFVWNVSNTNSN